MNHQQNKTPDSLDKILATVRTLLAIADGGSPYPAEQEAARERAERLMIRHSIDGARVVMSGQEKRRPIRRDTDIHGSYKLDKMSLLAAVYTAFGCRPIRFRERKTRQETVRAYGFAHDIEMATALIDSLLPQMLIGMAAHGGTAADRRTFAFGFASTVQTRLQEFYASALQQAETEGTGSALVLANRAQEVDRAMQQDYDRPVKTAAPRHLTGNGLAAGVAAGRDADITLGDRNLTKPARTIAR